MDDFTNFSLIYRHWNLTKNNKLVCKTAKNKKVLCRKIRVSDELSIIHKLAAKVQFKIKKYGIIQQNLKVWH